MRCRRAGTGRAPALPLWRHRGALHPVPSRPVPVRARARRCCRAGPRCLRAPAPPASAPPRPPPAAPACSARAGASAESQELCSAPRACKPPARTAHPAQPRAHSVPPHIHIDSQPFCQKHLGTGGQLGQGAVPGISRSSASLPDDPRGSKFSCLYRPTGSYPAAPHRFGDVPCLSFGPCIQLLFCKQKKAKLGSWKENCVSLSENHLL